MISKSFSRLRTYSESQNFAGWDPYDGLNSKVFRFTPFKHWDLARLFWIQAFKRNPVNFRTVFFVPKEHNAKGIGLFLTGYCNLYKAQQQAGKAGSAEQADVLKKIDYLAQLLISMQSKGYAGACWGYNFDWQSKAFFLPKNTPTVVATSFAVEALLNAFEITGNTTYKDIAVSAADFILKDLNRIIKPNGFMFSYSPIDKQAVYNATLLGSKTLALIYSHKPIPEYKNAALASVRAVCDLQNADGSFPHSDQVGNTWRDNFHTGFKLESIAYVQKYCVTTMFQNNIETGFRYWIDNFFNKETGRAYYYDTKGSLVDLHCAAQSISTLYKLGEITQYIELTKKILTWAIENMQADDGSFYFQKNGKRLNKIKYIRWPNAWMFYGLSYFLLAQSEHETN